MAWIRIGPRLRGVSNCFRRSRRFAEDTLATCRAAYSSAVRHDSIGDAHTYAYYKRDPPLSRINRSLNVSCSSLNCTHLASTMRDHHRRHNHCAEHHTFCHPHFRSAEFHGSHFHGHRHPGRGLHWVGLAVLATTFVRKGKGEPVFWFGLGALVTGLFMKHRASLENAWSHRCRSGRSGDDAKKRSFSWRLTVVGDDANEGRAHHSCRVHDTCRGGVSSPATDDDMCSCGYVEAKDATQVETLFDATNDTEASEDGDLLHPAPREPKAGEAAPIAAQQPVSR